ncbi:glycoside hydrolase family 3 C-terminal domain-containing protein [Artemisia annua]|uniref:Glycoside hydrolase family 3 C-terminal domain-containing protein n=1 Tax=Artemisia annua TaxID=35608 RepID=A0A2U1M881_ARTAN|nr:glycoside hydrolase family 3 C-terminal domain-containing protein [Artemisia annua]
MQLVNGAPGVERLGVSEYEWWSEALHGVSRHGKGVRFNGSVKASTMFPQVILTAASFDSRIWYRIGQAIGREARAMYNNGQARGLTFWAPNINVLRDPRWGRGQETPGEDPLVVGDYSVSYVRGIQGDSFEGGKIDPNSDHLQASACCKHFIANDLDNWKTVNRYNFDANINQQDLADTYLPPFQKCVQQGQASGIMCAYNRVNGVPNCADYNLLTKTARQAWKFKGYIASDCDAVAIMHDVQGYSKLPEDAVASVLKAGMDVNCGSYLKKYTKSAVQMNKITEADIDRALVNLFTIRMRLGLFNGNPKDGIYGKLGPDQVCSKENQDLALEAARNGIVLLKNSANLLPLSKTKTTSIAVIGPNVVDWFGWSVGGANYRGDYDRFRGYGWGGFGMKVEERKRNLMILRVERRTSCEKVNFKVVVGVENHGQASNHTVLLFTKWNGKDLNGHVIKKLVGYQRASLGTRKRGQVEFVVKPCEHFSSANEDGLMIIDEGSRSLVVGDQEYTIDIVI